MSHLHDELNILPDSQHEVTSPSTPRIPSTESFAALVATLMIPHERIKLRNHREKLEFGWKLVPRLWYIRMKPLPELSRAPKLASKPIPQLGRWRIYSYLC